MFDIFYWTHGPKKLCTLIDYESAVKAVQYLKEKYPSSHIWMEPVRATSLAEFKGRYKVIHDYEK